MSLYLQDLISSLFPCFRSQILRKKGGNGLYQVLFLISVSVKRQWRPSHGCKRRNKITDLYLQCRRFVLGSNAFLQSREAKELVQVWGARVYVGLLTKQRADEQCFVAHVFQLQECLLNDTLLETSLTKLLGIFGRYGAYRWTEKFQVWSIM